MRSVTASALFSLLSLGCAAHIKPVMSPVSNTDTLLTIVQAPSDDFLKSLTEEKLLSQDFSMVIQQQEKMLLVLSISPEKELSTNAPQIVSKRNGEVVLKKTLEAAPSSITGWVGKEVALFGGGSPRCHAFVRDVYLQGNIFISSDEYPFGQDINEEPMSDADFAENAWESGRVLLVAELSSTGGCEGATFGRLPSLGKPVLATIEDPQITLKEKALKEFRTLSQYQEIQEEYSAYSYESFEGAPPKSELWENYYDSKPNVFLFQASNGKQLLSISSDVWMGCGDFNGSLFALFEVESDQSLHLITTSNQGINPQEVFDIQGDGTFEIIQGDEWYQLKNGQYQTVQSLYIPSDLSVCNC
jgi:hypothetical protein